MDLSVDNINKDIFFYYLKMVDRILKQKVFVLCNDNPVGNLVIEVLARKKSEIFVYGI